jgi:SAM-dependent methyltransferase
MSLPGADGRDAGARQRIQVLETRVQALVRELAAAGQRTSELERQLAKLREKVDGSGARFAALYAYFTDRFRGSVEQITAKLQGYLPDVRELVGDAGAGRDGTRVLDIGCGRGEWLTLLKTVGVSAAGVDSHPAFVEAGRSRGLDMVLGDGIEHLATRPANSLDIVTAFHVIEHLDVETLLALVEAARDALRIGGCLLLETPNPHNLQMAACDFYNDPTHRRPLPPALVEFLVSASGFQRVEIRPLHPASSPLVSLNDDELGIELVERALYGPQDYAVLGYKIDSMDQA